MAWSCTVDVVKADEVVNSSCCLAGLLPVGLTSGCDALADKCDD